MSQAKEVKLSKDEFTHKAIVSLRQGKRKGIHVVYSGFNNAFKDYFDGADPKEHTDSMEAKGMLKISPTKGGVIIYHPDDAPNTVEDKTQDVFAKMGIKK